MLQFSSASSTAMGSRAAMRECVDAATQSLQGPCSLLVFHTTIGHDFDELLAEAAERCPDAELVGSTANGVVGVEGASERMRALAVMAISGHDFTVAHADSVRGSTSFEAAARAAQTLKDNGAVPQMIAIAASGIDISGDRALDGIASVFGPDVPVFGGTSGDNMRARVSYQFVGDQVLERGVVLVAFNDPTLRLVCTAHHGSEPIGRPFTVTRSTDNRIEELDGHPAWPTLMGRLGLPVNIDVAETLPVAALGQEIPEELVSSYDSRHVIHTIFLVDDDRKAFYTPASVPEGTRLWLMQRNEERIFSGVDRITAEMDEMLDGARPVAIFHTDCAARGRLMFNRVLKEEIVAKLQHPLFKGEPIPWLGTYGFGEFTPIAGKNRFHTQTSSIYALVRTAS